jgi:wobble nucleotide-excising tRNase
MGTFEEKDCLDCNPFEGDFGSQGDRILTDKMVTARKGGECSLCAQEIKAKERIRTMSAVFDGEFTSYRWCNDCCAAMAKSWTDDGEAWEERYRLRASK